jgi:hypothetical protein
VNNIKDGKPRLWLILPSRKVVGVTEENYLMSGYLAELPTGYSRNINCTLWYCNNEPVSNTDVKLNF